MKKNFKWLILGMLVILSFATTSFKTDNSDDWGNWFSPNSSYNGIDVRVRKGSYNEYSKKWQWDLQFRNRYHKKVTFQYGITSSYNRNSCSTRQRTSINGDEPETNDDTRSFLLNEANSVYVCLGNVEFGN